MYIYIYIFFLCVSEYFASESIKLFSAKYYFKDLLEEESIIFFLSVKVTYTRVRTLIVATIYLQLIQNRYMFRSFTVLQCSHQQCVQPVASDVEVVGYL